MHNKTFVMGDIHGAYNALVQVLDRAQFNNTSDRLICLGDVCDGWPETKQCIEKLLGVNNLVYLMGNHDYWALQWMQGEEPGETWAYQGGDATVTSYSGVPPNEHMQFLKNAKLYHILENRLFVHAGIEPSVPIEQQTQKTLLWDRELATLALQHHRNKTSEKLTDFDEVYIGHTPIHNLGHTKPIKICEVWFMDTGAGWNGCLSMMNIETREIFTSDLVPELYPNHSGRF